MRVRKEILTVAAALSLVLFAGAAGYMLLEGWNFLDSLYMTVITLATVGYGETHPLSGTGRIFTICLIFGGIGIAAYSFSTLTAVIMQGRLTDAFRRRKMENNIRALSEHYVICGAGRTGMSIAGELKKTGRAFVFVEACREKADGLMHEGHLAVCGDAAQDAALTSAGAERAAGVFCCLGNDKDNAFAALSARLLNPRARIISSLVSDDALHKLLKSGADAAVNPGHIGGLRMASEMVRPSTVGFLDYMMREGRLNYRFEDVSVPAKKRLEHLGRGGPLVVALKRVDGYLMNPPAATETKDGDVLVVLGTPEEISELKNRI